MTASSPPGLGPEEVAELRAYRKAWGCLACGEDHPPECICPPHEVRTTGMAWFRVRAQGAIERAAVAEAKVTALLASLDATAARVVELEAALKPFARALLLLPVGDAAPDDTRLVLAELWNSFPLCTVGHLREAARALSVSPDGDRPEQETKS